MAGLGSTKTARKMPMPDFDPAFVQRVLDMFQDSPDDLWWARDGKSTKSGRMRFYVKCNDTFYYACTDFEEITPDNIDLLEQTFAECVALGNHADCYAPTLFVARVRKMKPLPEVLAYQSCQPLVALFNAVG